MTNYHSDKNMVHNIHQQKCYSIDNLTDQSSKSCLNNKRLCPVTHDDSQSIVHCINDSNHQQQRPPPPLMSYSTMINSPARSKRGSPSSDPDEDDFQVITHTTRFISSRTIINSNNINNQRGPPDHQNVTTASARYATSRFPFPPYIIRFKSNQITLNKFKEEVVKCVDDDMDILLYVKDSISFASLYDETKWPLKIAGEDYMFPSRPKLLSSNTNPTAVPPNNNNNNNYRFDSLNFPPLPSTQAQLNNPMMSKLDDLIGKINDVKDHLASLTLKYDKFEKFMVEKAKHDIHVSHQIDTLSANDQEFKKDLLNHHMLLGRHENFFTKLFIPILEEVFSWMAVQNQDKKGNTLDADLKCRLERYVVQMRKTREGKHRFN
ncbi:unnamed protein product [Rotaria sordida]|uniref:Uncharacterized protein n=1 Tax=Rotaria sordida TaxID=392033 RepID=A0A814WRP7_9BILA|nr:unnamed protein product [Rotaria sordida]